MNHVTLVSKSEEPFNTLFKDIKWTCKKGDNLNGVVLDYSVGTVFENNTFYTLCVCDALLEHATDEEFINAIYMIPTDKAGRIILKDHEITLPDKIFSDEELVQ